MEKGSKEQMLRFQDHHHSTQVLTLQVLSIPKTLKYNNHSVCVTHAYVISTQRNANVRISQ
jgi:hypothetical protein